MNYKEDYKIDINDIKNIKPTTRELKPSRKIVQFNKDGTPIKIWRSTTTASIVLKVKKSNIYHALQGRSKTAHGYQWKFLEEVIEGENNGRI